MVGHKGQVVGYVRVSSIDQNESRQVAALGDVDRLFTERVSGKDVRSRPMLQELIAYVREGDLVRVKSPDRLSRSTTDLLALMEQMKGKGVDVEFVDNPALNTGTPQGTFMLTILAAVAELERATIRERQAEGIALAKQRGVYERSPALTTEQIATARERIATGVPKAVVARDLGVSRQTLYTALKGAGAYRD
ncbi:recombinase family protein [Brachybacterium sp. sponge]|uniref:recombinase family protein n=1 Tax=Brachybacterium sp. sponge TaxID=1775432 RepID=UPI0007A54C61|nr:recombinase family protein [Brachybacterium sp. sponge]